MLRIDMPLYCRIGIKKPKNHYFNLNNYRNWHYQVSNNLKKWYKEIAGAKLTDENAKVMCRPVQLTFILYRKDKRKGDRSNVLSVHEKFFCDALVELGYIGDDSDLHIDSTHYFTGGVDLKNPRVEIWVEETV